MRAGTWQNAEYDVFSIERSKMQMSKTDNVMRGNTQPLNLNGIAKVAAEFAQQCLSNWTQPFVECHRGDWILLHGKYERTADKRMAEIVLSRLQGEVLGFACSADRSTWAAVIRGRDQNRFKLKKLSILLTVAQMRAECEEPNSHKEKTVPTDLSSLSDEELAGLGVMWCPDNAMSERSVATTDDADLKPTCLIVGCHVKGTEASMYGPDSEFVEIEMTRAELKNLACDYLDDCYSIRLVRHFDCWGGEERREMTFAWNRFKALHETLALGGSVTDVDRYHDLWCDIVEGVEGEEGDLQFLNLPVDQRPWTLPQTRMSDA
jgi:hypothetical protein